MRTTTAEPIAHPQLEEIELAAVLHALSDPVRLRIVAGLAGRTIAAAAASSCR